MTAASPLYIAGDRSLVYVFGVTRASRGRNAAAAQLEGIIPDAPVEPLVHADLMAFVSAVPASQFGASEFPSALGDAQWLKDRILAHERVVEELRSRYDVLPFRFGTIYLDAAQVSKALARHRVELCRALDRVRKASEWGVKIYCDETVLRRLIDAEPGPLRNLRNAIAHASPGAGFFLQKKYARACDDAAAAWIARAIARSRRRLAGCAAESVSVELQSVAIHGRPAPMVMNVACLVADESCTRFRQTVAALAKEFAACGFTYELTGPWPPYHFASVRQQGIADGAGSDQ
jgi:Gas vesicle synthesis protein GvpL/GvpF